MPLGYREIVLVIRGQNTAGPAIRSLVTDLGTLNAAQKKTLDQALQRGQSLITMGAVIGVMGAAGLAFFADATKQAIEYNKQVALTRTQMYGVKASFDQTAQAGLNVAKAIAVPLDQIQSGLYDIFSSMDVNLAQAQYLLTNFSKEAVAGQVDLSTAERASIGIMNSYQMKVSDVVKVQDIMFNLVKYGVGTYADFANVIGLVTPSAVRANQTFEQTASLMAFTTRNGLSAASAAAAVARGMDAIGKARDTIAHVGQVVVNNLGPEVAKKLGITAQTMIRMTDASGKLLPINQIMTELGSTLKSLNPTQLNSVLVDMFKGQGGTIQAMRFIVMAVKNYGQLNGMVKEMAHSKGALQAAYNVMANTPAMQIQLLKNNFQVMMIEIGNVVLPGLNKLVKGLVYLFGWIGKIPAPVLKIATIAGIAISALLLFAGVAIAAAGAFIILSTAIDLLDIALGPIILIVLAVIAVVALLAYAGYEIYKHWGPISKWFHDMWFAMWHWINKIWNDIWKSIHGWWLKIMVIFNQVKSFIVNSFDKWWKTHGDEVKAVWRVIWTFVTYWFKYQWTIISGTAKIAWAIFSTMIRVTVAYWTMVFKIGWAVISGIFRAAWAVLLGAWRIWLTVITAVFKILWAGLQAAVKIAWDVIVGIFSIFLDLVTGHWSRAWTDLKAMGIQIWNAIKQYLQSVWNILKSSFSSIFKDIENIGVGIWHAMYSTVQTIWKSILGFFSTTWDALRSGFKAVVKDLGGIWDGLKTVFKTPVNWVIQNVYDDGIAKLWNLVMNAIGLKSIDMPIVKTMAAGGRLAGFGGGDILPALLEPGETVVDKHRSRKYASVFRMMGVPGYATGGVAGASGIPGGSVLTNLVDYAKMALAIVTGNPVAFGNALAGTFLHKTPAGVAGNWLTAIAHVPEVLIDNAAKGAWNQIVKAWNATAVATGPGGVGVPGPGGGSPTANMQLAWQLMPAWAYGSIYWPDWLQLWTRESGWNQFARNPTSGAYGIPQALPPSKMGAAANPPQSNVRAQETWGIGYIQGRYGNPINAWAHEVAMGWYGAGTDQVFTRPTIIGVGDGGPERVQVTPMGHGRGHGPIQNFFITTQEINPRRHAAELGWELARRSSLCRQR